EDAKGLELAGLRRTQEGGFFLLVAGINGHSGGEQFAQQGGVTSPGCLEETAWLRLRHPRDSILPREVTTRADASPTHARVQRWSGGDPRQEPLERIATGEQAGGAAYRSLSITSR